MFVITINGRPVSYLKRVADGAPHVIFARNGELGFRYGEGAAKAWVTTCKMYFADVKMVPATR